jgi:hypothetical protein
MLREQPKIHMTIACMTLNRSNFMQMAGNTRLVPRTRQLGIYCSTVSRYPVSYICLQQSADPPQTPEGSE